MRNRDTIKGALLLAAAAIGLAAFSYAAAAQVLNPDDVLTVRPRSVNKNAASGVRLGSFLFSPGIEAKTLYDDNIFRTENNKQSDLITSVKPAFALQSDWLRHGIFFGAEGDFGFYAKESRQNYEDYGVLASGQYDIAYNTYFTGAVSQARRHQDRGSVFDTDGDSLISYIVTSELIGFTRAVSFIKLKMQAKNEDVKISQDDRDAAFSTDDYRDRNNKQFQATLSYEFMPGNEVFLTETYDTTDYTLFSGGDRNSDGTDTRVGLNFDDGGVWSGSLYGGYIQRNYDTGDDDTKKPYFGGRLRWKASALTTVTFTLDKAFRDTTVTNAAGVVNTTRRVEVAQQFTPYLTGTATAGYDDNDYVGGDGPVNRNTHLYYAGAGVKYDLSDGIGLRFGYDYRERTSNHAFDEYQDNRVMVSLTYMY